MPVRNYILNDKIATELLELSNDAFSLKLNLESLLNKINKELLVRLNKWFSYFNSNHAQCVCYYQQTVLALLDSIENNVLLKTQTSHEFRLSLKFYDFIIDSNIFIKIDNIELAQYLLNISLIFGKYPGMVIRPFKKSLKTLNEGVSSNSLQLLFISLFVKYESPRIFIKHLNLLSSVEIEALMHILQGNNIRTFNELKLTISKKESFILVNRLPDNLDFNNLILERTIVCSKLLNSKYDNPYLLNEIVSSSKIFNYNLDSFTEDINFWKQVFVFLSKIDWAEHYLTIQEFIDYFEYQKYSENSNYSLKNRTFKSVSSAIIRWHNEIDYLKKKNLISLSWIRKSQNDYFVNENSVKYQFKELTNGEELFAESKELNHCVFSYIESCAAGYLSIWSLKKEMSSSYKSQVTIEVWDNKIIQAKGKRNRMINKSEHLLIKSWAKALDYNFSDNFSQPII